MQVNWRYPVCLVITVLLTAVSNSSHAQEALWRSYFDSAQRAYQAGNYSESDKLLNSALDAARGYDDSLRTFFYLAHVCEKQGRFDQAEGYYRTVLDYLQPRIWTTLRPPEGTPAWETEPSADSEQVRNPEKFLSEFKRHKEPLLGSHLAKPITAVDVLTDLAYLLQQQKKYQEAERIYRSALILTERRPDAAPVNPKILQRLASLYRIQGKETEAIALVKEAESMLNGAMPGLNQLVDKQLKDLEGRFGKSQTLMATRLNNLALFCSTQGDYMKADRLYCRALECCESRAMKDKPELAVIYRNYADLLEAMGRNDEAKRYQLKAQSFVKTETIETGGKGESAVKAVSLNSVGGK